MRFFIVSLILFLSGCANDNYVLRPNTQGSQEKMASDLHDCKMEAIHAYNEGRPDVGAAAGIAGVLGGAVGGALVGAASAADTPDNAMKASDINPYVTHCMEKRGYKGSST